MHLSEIINAQVDIPTFAIAIDSQCSCTASGDISHFQNLKPITYGQSITVEGINGVMKAT